MLTANPVLTATHTAGLPSSGQQHGQQTQIQTQQTQAAAPNQHNVVMCVSRGRGLGYHHKAGALAAAAHRVKRAYRVPGRCMCVAVYGVVAYCCLMLLWMR